MNNGVIGDLNSSQERIPSKINSPPIDISSPTGCYGFHEDAQFLHSIYEGHAHTQNTNSKPIDSWNEKKRGEKWKSPA